MGSHAVIEFIRNMLVCSRSSITDDSGFDGFNQEVALKY